MEKICVLGNAGIEIKIFLQRIPEKNQEEEIKNIVVDIGGSGACVAAAFSSLGFKSFIVTQIGKNSNGNKVLSKLRELRVDISHTLISLNSTISFFSIFDGDFNRMFLIKPIKYSEKKILENFKKSANRTNLLVICPTMPSLSLKAAEIGKKMEKVVVISPQSAFIRKPYQWLKKFFAMADFIFLNIYELLNYTKTESLPQALKSSLMNGDQIVVVTKGSRGCTVISKGKTINTSGVGRYVIDPTGAGDAFLAGFLWSYMKDHDLKKASHEGCLAGSAFCMAKKLSKKASLLKDAIIHRRFKDYEKV
jgi:sugar/nucleoside kinase (ribokinase family)